MLEIKQHQRKVEETKNTKNCILNKCIALDCIMHYNGLKHKINEHNNGYLGQTQMHRN